FVFVNVRLSRARHAARRIAGTLQQAAPQPAGIPPAYLPPSRPQSAASKPHRANTLPARRGLRPSKNTKNYPDCATIFRRLLLFSQKENKIAGSDAINYNFY
ncbi:hypothetical protein NE555_16010, partial [Alistipes onderdonkii]|uniref:hypothetical protein n=1 Tax=Alistipes onderdonkii TaxID=328813 RepID=UPI00210D1407